MFFDWSNQQMLLWIIVEVLLLLIVCYGFLISLLFKSKLSRTLKVLCLLWIIYSSLFLIAASLDQSFLVYILKFLNLPFNTFSSLVKSILLSYYVWVTLTSLLGFMVLKDIQEKKKKRGKKPEKLSAR